MIEMPLVMTGPWTREARDAVIRYFRKAVKVRNWPPWDDLPLAEMAARGPLLSEDTVTIIEAYLGVEDYSMTEDDTSRAGEVSVMAAEDAPRTPELAVVAVS